MAVIEPGLSSLGIPADYGLEPKAAFIFSTILSMIAISVISFCLSRRTKNFKWGHVTLARWLVLAIYVDSWLFVFSSTILHTSIGLNSAQAVCGAAILLCLVFYLSSKMIYLFLVEKVYIIRSKHICTRRQDKMYLFNTLGMLFPYGIIICLTFIFRVAKLLPGKQCEIGIGLQANIPLLVFDVSINVYLTSLFLIPLIGSYGFDQKNPRLRAIAKRTFIGSIATLTSSIMNLTMMMIMRGHEPGWVCFACCNGDVVFSAAVLHWVTSSDGDPPPPQKQITTTARTTKCITCKNKSYGFSRNGKSSTWRSSVGNADFIWAGQLGETTTEIVGGREPHAPPQTFSMDGITVRIDTRREIEYNAEPMVMPLPEVTEEYNEAAMDDMKISVHENGRSHEI